DVADVVEVEGEHGAQARMADRYLRALHPRLVQTVVVDALLPILGHRAPGGGRLRAVIFHRVFLTFSLSRASADSRRGRVQKIGRGIARRPLPTFPATGKENA